MNKKIMVGLLSLIALLQILTIVGGFMAYEQMSYRYWELVMSYKELAEEKYGLIIDFGIEPNPFAPIIPLVLLTLFLTIALLIIEINEIRQIKASETKAIITADKIEVEKEA